MGIGAWWHWLIVLIIVLLVFGTKKLRNIGGDVGGAVKGFKDAMSDAKNADNETAAQAAPVKSAAKTEAIEAEVIAVPAEKSAAKKRAPATKKTATTKAATAKPKTTATKKVVAKPKATTSAKKSSVQ